MINVIIIDDHEIVREGLTLLIERQPDIRLVGQSASGLDAVEMASSVTFDVMILDQELPDIRGDQVVERVLTANSDSKILVLSSHREIQNVRRCLKSGAKGYLLKHEPFELVIEAVRSVSAGEEAISQELATELAKSYGQPILSSREIEVLELVAKGNSNKQVGQLLFITEGTVKGHLNKIAVKLNSKGRAESVAEASKLGYIEL